MYSCHKISIFVGLVHCCPWLQQICRGILFSTALQGILHKNRQILLHIVGEPHFLCHDGLEIGKISEGLPIAEIVEGPSTQVSAMKA